jgi:hypothetical protein
MKRTVRRETTRMEGIQRKLAAFRKKQREK